MAAVTPAYLPVLSLNQPTMVFSMHASMLRANMGANDTGYVDTE